MSSYEYFFTDHSQPSYHSGQKHPNQGSQHYYHHHYPHHHLSRQSHHCQKLSSSLVHGGGPTVGCGVGGLHSPPASAVCSHGSSHLGTVGSTHEATLSWKTTQNDETVSVTSSASSNVSPSSASSMFFRYPQGTERLRGL